MLRDCTTSSFIRRSRGAQQRFKQCLNGDVTQIPARTITRPLSDAGVPNTSQSVTSWNRRDEKEWRVRARTLAGIITGFHQLLHLCAAFLTFNFTSQWNSNALTNGHDIFLRTRTPMLNDISHLLNQVGGNTHSQKSESRCCCWTWAGVNPPPFLWAKKQKTEIKMKK